MSKKSILNENIGIDCPLILKKINTFNSCLIESVTRKKYDKYPVLCKRFKLIVKNLDASLLSFQRNYSTLI